MHDATANGSEHPVVRFVLEQHLGHKTYSDNLKAESEGLGADAIWVDVDYRHGISPRFARGPVASLAGSLAGRREVRAGLRRPGDITVFNTQVPAALAGAALAAPYIVVTDVTPVQYDRMAEGYGHRVDRSGVSRRWKHRRNLAVFRGAAHCVGWSSWAANSIVADYGVAASEVSVIPPGVDTARWTPGPRNDSRSPLNVLFVGGDFARKGGDRLVEVVSSLSADVSVTVVTKSRVAGSDRVHVVDDLEPNDPRLIALYQRADIFALPSKAETFGIAAVEAQAAGLPVIATRLGGLTDIVEHETTGLLIEPDDPGSLRRAVERLVFDRDLRAVCSGAARAKAVQEFDAATNARRLFDLAWQHAAGREP